MNVIINRTIDNSITLKMEPSDTIKDLRAKIQDATGLSPILQGLIYGDHELAEDSTLMDNDIHDGSRISLIVLWDVALYHPAAKVKL